MPQSRRIILFLCDLAMAPRDLYGLLRISRKASHIEVKASYRTIGKLVPQLVYLPLPA
jgi:hypothetical protein